MSARIASSGCAMAVAVPECPGLRPHCDQSCASATPERPGKARTTASALRLHLERIGIIIARHHKRRYGNSGRTKGVHAQRMHPKFRRGSTVAALVIAAIASSAIAQEHPPSDANRPVKSPGNAQWAKDADDAKAKAAAQNKLVFYEFD